MTAWHSSRAAASIAASRRSFIRLQPDTGVVPVVVKMKGLSGFAFTLAISSRTSGESGTVCPPPFFVLLPGMFQVAPSSLSSRRVMPAISFRLWPVSINTPRTALRS